MRRDSHVVAACCLNYTNNNDNHKKIIIFLFYLFYTGDHISCKSAIKVGSGQKQKKKQRSRIKSGLFVFLQKKSIDIFV